MLNYKKIQDLQIKLEKAQQRLNNKLEKFEELKKDGDLHASSDELRFLKPEYQLIFKTN